MKDSIHIHEFLQTADWGVFGAVLLLTLGAVVFGNLRQRRFAENDEAAKLLDLLLMDGG